MKNMKRTLLTCITLLATGAFAGQYTSSPSSAQPSQVPSQSAPQSAQPDHSQSAQPGQQSAQQPGRPSIDDQVKMLTQELNLTPEQQTKIKNVLENQHQQAMTIINDSSLAREDKIQTIRSLRETTITQARAMLNDNQKKKLDGMLAESDRLHQNGGAAPSSSSPSGSSSSSSPAGAPPASSSPGTSPSSTSPAGTPPARPPR